MDTNRSAVQEASLNATRPAPTNPFYGLLHSRLACNTCANARLFFQPEILLFSPFRHFLLCKSVPAAGRAKTVSGLPKNAEKPAATRVAGGCSLC
jgi:hypothetical protein